MKNIALWEKCTCLAVSLMLGALTGCNGDDDGVDATPESAAPALLVPALGAPLLSTGGRSRAVSHVNDSFEGVPSGRLYVFRADGPMADPIQITDDAIDPIGFAYPADISGTGEITPRLPTQFLYATYGAPGGDRVWVLDLAPVESPSPRQVSHLVLGEAGAVQICSRFTALRDLEDEASAFAILALATDPSLRCSSPVEDWRFVLVSFGDDEGTAPVELPALGWSGIELLYGSDGVVAGVVAIDSSRTLNFYADESLTNPVPLLTSVRQTQPLSFARHDAFGAVRKPGPLVIDVDLAGGLKEIHRIDVTGEISPPLYARQGYWSSIDPDATGDIYAADVEQTFSTTTTRVLRISTTGTVQILATDTVAADTDGPLAVVGANDSTLVLSRHRPLGSPVQSTVFYTSSSSAPSEPVPIAEYAGIAGAKVRADALYVTQLTPIAGDAGPFEFASAILGLDGDVRQPLTEHTAIGDSVGEPVLYVRDIEDSDGVGGGTIHVLTPGATSAGADALMLPDGTEYRLPSATPSAPLVYFVAPDFGLGVTSQAEAGGTVLVIDTARHEVVPLKPDGISFTLPIL